jgi:glycosyltransferase involved in cell wall biosynthesis
MCTLTAGAPPSILGISFDGFPISGIVNEFLHLSAVLRGGQYRVLCDLGYDITRGRTIDLGTDHLPGWVTPIRTLGPTLPVGYTPELVNEARARAVAGISVAATPAYHDVVRQVSTLLLETFTRENVRLLVVENGTLPANPIFTEALYAAITAYGSSRELGKYVIWRDHDLMWSAEPHLHGVYPYPGVRIPQPNEHIHYVVTTDWMRQRLLAWAPAITCHVIPCRFFTPAPNPPHRPLRASYGIPEDAFLVARCTRVAPQKSIDRDLYVFHQVQMRLAALGDPRKVFLVVTGPTQEDPAEFQKLRELEQTLSIAGQVVWADGLRPFHAATMDPGGRANRFSVRDLLSEADLSSFLTSYGYEGFGMPPGEAMAMRVPFISTTYELYHDVYGSKGAIAPLLPIHQDSVPEDPVPEFFVQWTVRALTDAAYRTEIIERNWEVVRRFFSISSLAAQLREIVGECLGDTGNAPPHCIGSER